MEAFLLNILVGAGFGLVSLLVGILVSKFLRPWVDAKPTRYEFARELLMVTHSVCTEIHNSEYGKALYWDDKTDIIIEKIATSLGVDLSNQPGKADAIKREVNNKINELKK